LAHQVLVSARQAPGAPDVRQPVQSRVCVLECGTLLSSCWLEADGLADQQDGGPAGKWLGVDDKKLVYGTRLAVRSAGPRILQRQGVGLDAPQSRCQIGNDLLCPDDQDHPARATGVCRQLAAARRHGDQGPVLCNGGDAAHDEIGSSPQAADLVAVRLAVECPDARLYGDESVGVVDVRFDISKAQRLAGGGEHRCSIWQEGSYTSAGRLRIVKNFDHEWVGGGCMRGAIDVL